LQAKNVQDALGTISKQLKTKNLPLKRSQRHLVRQKLGDANNYIRSAASKLGLQPQADEIPPDMAGLSRFVAMVNSGQNQLVEVQQQLDRMASQGANVNPAEMLSVQVKMGLAEQELNYTSVLLGKVIQSFTQLLNTQL
jgi:flagellar hook-basal body complex protein FliE